VLDVKSFFCSNNFSTLLKSSHSWTDLYLEMSSTVI
jgi:hypothetical protein